LKSKASAVADLTGETIGKRSRRSLRHVAGRMAGRAMLGGARAGAHMAARAAERMGVAGAEAALDRARRLPIQRSIDVAVPIDVAWEQWMELCHLPEGTHRLDDVNRDGDRLNGCLSGRGAREWEAEIVDEREQESFAWRSTEGSDSAGLVTFHELAERLTRIELNLDIRPQGVLEAAALALRVADLRVQAELRRFKAEVELLNPDDYEELLSHNGGGRSQDDEEDGRAE
jgi:uncharacterized membrane protein